MESKSESCKSKPKRKKSKRKCSGGFLAKHPWIRGPMLEQVSEYGNVSKNVLMYGDKKEDDEIIQCLKELSLKQRVYLQGIIRKEVSRWARQAYCDKETQLARIALQAFEQKDYTLGVIYRYINEGDISEALKIQ